jgi:hypothetical protein
MDKRIVGIDIARAFAILLVTWKHSMASFGAKGAITGWPHHGLEFLMQLATPTFLILFGVMLELVYRPRFERGLQPETSRRLYRRAAQCYGYYCLAIIVFFAVMGTYSWMAMPLVFSGFISVPYSHLLAFYTAALALAPLLILVRIRFGLTGLIGLSILIHALHPWLSTLPSAPLLFGRDYLQHMSGFLYGRGVDFIGPSLLHGMSIVCFGMLFGYGLKAARKATGTLQALPRIPIAMVAACALVVLALWNWDAPGETLQRLLQAELRIDSHPLYFSTGILGAIIMSWGFIYLNDILGLRFGRSLQVFGRRSLFAFGIGNILAYIAPPSMVTFFGLWGSVGLLFGTVCLLTLLYDQIELRRPIISSRLLAWRQVS